METDQEAQIGADVVKLRRWFLNDDDTLVRVKSWWPSRGPYGIEWPKMLVDNQYGQRRTTSPVWDWARIKYPFEQ